MTPSRSTQLLDEIRKLRGVLKAAEARLGTADETPGDMALARDTAHTLRNRVMILYSCDVGCSTQPLTAFAQ